jgi:hypothetical protein
MNIDLNDVVSFGGLAILTGGVGYQFGPAYAAIVCGGLLFAIGFWKA